MCTLGERTAGLELLEDAVVGLTVVRGADHNGTRYFQQMVVELKSEERDEAEETIADRIRKRRHLA